MNQVPATQSAEHKLVLAAKKSAGDAIHLDIPNHALVLAGQVKDMRVECDADDTVMTDVVGTLARGRKAIENYIAPVKNVLNDAKKALLDGVRPHLERIEKAEREGETKQRAYRQKKRVEAEKALAAERARAAQAAAEAQQETGESIPPASIPAPIEQRVVRGAGATSYETRTLHVELHNHHECDPSWLALTPTARAAAMAARDSKDLAVPDGREAAVTWNGLRVWNEVGIATRT